MNKKILSIFVLVLTLSFTTQAFASLTFTSDAITGTTASSIDLGAGNALSLQTTGNAPITTGTGLVTTGGNLKINGALGIAGTTVDSNKYINITVAGIDNTSSAEYGIKYGGYFSLDGNLNNDNSMIGIGSYVTKSSGAFNHGALVGVLAKSGINAGISTDSMSSLDGETQIQGSANQAYGTYSQVLAYGAGSIGQAYGVYADTVAIQTSSIADAYGAIAKVRQSNTATITRAYGLALSGWGGTAGTSYGIYMDTSIDIGTTRYAIYSTSTSKSYLAGNLGIGKTSPGSKLSVVGLPAYANNAAALAGGLTAGDFYYTDVSGEYIVKITH